MNGKSTIHRDRRGQRRSRSDSKAKYQAAPSAATSATGDRFELFLVDPSQWSGDAPTLGQPLFSLQGTEASFDAHQVTYDGAQLEIELAEAELGPDAQLLMRLTDENGQPDTRITVRPLVNQVADGFLATDFITLDGDPTQSWLLTADWIAGVAGYREVGLFMMDDGAGHVDGVSPDDPTYADTILNSSHRVLLFSGSLSAASPQEMVYHGGDHIGLYILHDSPDMRVPAEHLRFRQLGGNRWSIGWEDLHALVPNWLPLVGDRGFDDGVFEVIATQQAIVPQPPVLAPSPDRVVSESQLVSFVVTAADPDTPVSALRYQLGAGAPAETTLMPKPPSSGGPPTKRRGPANTT